MTIPALPAAIRRRNQRISRYQALVKPLAIHYALRCQEPLDDLIQVGLLGLLRAAELFREGGGTPFEAFARPHVRGAILHYLRDEAPALRLPRRLAERQQQLQTLRRLWWQHRDVEASAEDLRKAMGLSAMQWRQLEEACRSRRLLSLSEHDHERQPLAAPCADPPLQAGVVQALEQLDPGLQVVVRRVILEGHSYRKAAVELQVSPMTVQRRLHRGLALLQQALTPSGDPLDRAASVAAAC